jgi:hypothetical protein
LTIVLNDGLFIGGKERSVYIRRGLVINNSLVTGALMLAGVKKTLAKYYSLASFPFSETLIRPQPPPPTMAQQTLVSQGLLIIEASRSYSDTPYSVGLLWTGDQPDAETST